jgi:DNA-binding transcriptional ArsR family regulator
MDAALRELAKKQAELCRVFGNASRILILWSLVDGELPVTEIADEVGTSLQNISQHLTFLKQYELVIARREGQMIYYRIADNDWIRDCPVLLKASQRSLVEK